MKKILISGLMFGTLALAGCTKDEALEGSDRADSATKTYSFNVAIDDARTVYEEGTGVHLKGDETVAVLYTLSDGRFTDNSQLKKMEGTQSSTNVFTFEADATKTYDTFYFMLPNTSEITVLNKQNDNSYTNYAMLQTVQAPESSTFESRCDVLLGEPVGMDALESGSATVYFKRLFTPVKVVLTNLESSEKVQAMTIQANGTPTSGGINVMSGFAVVAPDADYDKAGLTKWHSSRFSSGITAVYNDGLEAVNGGHNVWLVANPNTFDGFTVTVTTDKRIITRTIDASLTIPERKLKKITIDMAAATTYAENALTFGFVNDSSIKENDEFSLNGSDGVPYVWKSYNGVRYYEDAAYKHARGLMLPGANSSEACGAIQLPNLGSDKIVKKIRCVVDSDNGSKDSNVVFLQVSSDGSNWSDLEETKTSIVRNTIEQKNAGVFEIEVPNYNAAQHYRLTTTGASGVNAYLRNMTLVWESATVPAVKSLICNAEAATTNSLSFAIELNEYASSYYYICQPANETAPTADQIVDGKQPTSEKTLSISGLAEGTEYTLYVVPVGASGERGSVFSTTGETAKSMADYWERYQKGEDIALLNDVEIKAFNDGDSSVKENDFIINKTNYPTAVHITKDTQDALGEIKKGGLFFIDNDVTISDDSDHIKLSTTEKTILIGNSPTKQQPTLSTGKQLYANGPALILKNMNIHTDGANGITNSPEAGVADCTLIIEDCTFTFAQNAITENNPEKPRCYERIYIYNSVLHNLAKSANRAVYKDNTKTIRTDTYQFTYAKGELNMRAIVMHNSVLYAENPNQHYIVDAGSNDADRHFLTPHLRISVKNNSLYNIWQPNGLVRVWNLTSVYVGYNAGYYDNQYIYNTSNAMKNTYLFIDFAKTCQSITVEHNFLTGNNSLDNNSNGWKNKNHSNGSTFTDTTSEIYNKDVKNEFFPYSQFNATTGYFPINTSLVTNGVGATYDTKLWNTWE